MCFRPPTAQKPITCPNCQKKIAVLAGRKPEVCPHCKEKLPAEESK